MDNPEKLPTYGTEDEEKHNIICVVHQHTQTNTNNVNKTRALLQKTGGKDKPNIFFIFLFWILIFFDSKCPFVVPCFFLSSQFSTFYYFFLRKFQTHAHRIVFLCKIISVFHTFYMSTGLSSSARSSVSSIRCACPPDCLPLQDHQCLPYVLHAHRIVFLYKIDSVFHAFCYSHLQVPLVEQELPTIPEHLSSSLGFSGVRVTRSLILCVCCVDHCLSIVHFLLAIVLSVLL